MNADCRYTSHAALNPVYVSYVVEAAIVGRLELGTKISRVMNIFRFGRYLTGDDGSHATQALSHSCQAGE